MSSGVATVLIMYVVSGLLIIACAMMPGQGPLSRVVTLLVGLLIAGWGGWIIVFGAWHLVGTRLAVLPILAVLVLLKSLILVSRQPHPVPYPKATPLPDYHQPQPRQAQPRGAQPPEPPAQYWHVATAQPDERPRDPWAALYASTAARAAALGAPTVRRDR